MTTISNGTYNIINTVSGRYANLAQSVVAPYTPVIAWGSSGSGGANEKWVITALTDGTGTYSINSSLDANAFASVASHIQGGAVTNSTRAERFTINQVSGGYRINLGQNAWAHVNSNDADGIQIKLLPNGTANDVWNLVKL